jgi:hypothetical protein
MTVSSELNRKEYAGDGVTTAFATSPVVFFDSADLKVYVVTTATGAATLQTITTHYTVSGGSGSTGTVTMVTAPTSAQTLVIVRDVAATQSSDFVNNDINDAEVLEDALDRLTMLAQQNATTADRALRVADSDPASVETEMVTTGKAGYYVRLNTGGTAFELAEGDANTSTFTQSGSGAVERSVTAKLGEIVSVKDFGATGDGVTDDTAAIQAAIDAVFTLYGGGRIWFPVGSYRISQVKLKSYVVLEGESWKSALGSIDSNPNGSMISLFDTSVEYAGVRNFFINGRKSSQSGVVDAFDFDTAGDSGAHFNFLENCFIFECSGHGIHNKTQHMQMRNLWVFGCDLNGIFTDSTQDSRIHQSLIGESGLAGIKITGANCILSNTSSFESGQDDATQGWGVQCAPGTGVEGSYLQASNCDIADNLESGWFLDQVDGCTITGGMTGDNAGAQFRIKGGGGHNIKATCAGGFRTAGAYLLQFETDGSSFPHYCDIDITRNNQVISGGTEITGTVPEDNFIRIHGQDVPRVAAGSLEFSGTNAAEPGINFTGTYNAQCIDFNSVTATGGVIRLKNNVIGVVGRNAADDANVELFRISSLNEFSVIAAARFAADISFNTGVDIFCATSGAGTRLASTALQLLGFWGATPVVQQTLATGAGATADNIISMLQTIGLCKQS